MVWEINKIKIAATRQYAPKRLELRSKLSSPPRNHIDLQSVVGVTKIIKSHIMEIHPGITAGTYLLQGETGEEIGVERR